MSLNNFPQISKAAVLYKNNSPLRLININLREPKKYQVLVKIKYTGFCASQFGEITGVKGKDKYLPHCLGHEASGIVIKTGKGVTKVKKKDLVVLHWMKSEGRECENIFYLNEEGKKINSGKITTFSNYTIVSENRLTKITKKKHNPLLLPLMGCSVSVAISTLEKIAKVKKNKNILILGSGALGLPMIHYCKANGVKNIDVLEKNDTALKMSKTFGATRNFKSMNNLMLKKRLANNFYDYICDTTGSSKLITKIFQFQIICKFIFLGVPKFNERFKLNSLKINYGLKLLGSYGGNFKPHKDLKKYLNFLKKTRFNVKRYIHKIYDLDGINTLINDFKRNKIIGKALIKLN